MKKALLLSLLVIVDYFLPSLLFAQNVGIGTPTPQFKLDVLGRMRIKTGTIGNIFTTPGVWMEDYRDGSNRIFLGMQDSIRLGFWGEGTPSVGWGLNFNARNGNVGIGRIASSSRLEIDDTNGGNVSLYNNGTYSGTLRGTDTTLQLYSAYGSTNCIPNPCPSKDLIFLPPSNIFTGSFSGNIGIGTNAPTAKLQIVGGTNVVMIGSGKPATGYALSVNGKVISEELKVQMDANWPDYVFKKSYQLQSIDDIRKYIAEHGHLKNIPSAAEVEKEGIFVGDMQKRLMEKIEELTLYIIQLNDRIKQLEAAAKK